ncbi:hypothetical protein ILYODFUR_023435 [Ilyodon furcidens]|uniref:Uncharacterized protein n=1 Tax=Ilyodon furcidens TaxID=33524 RepID=A0ABV0UIT4_9TELE
MYHHNNDTVIYKDKSNVQVSSSERTASSAPVYLPGEHPLLGKLNERAALPQHKKGGFPQILPKDTTTDADRLGLFRLGTALVGGLIWTRWCPSLYVAPSRDGDGSRWGLGSARGSWCGPGSLGFGLCQDWSGLVCLTPSQKEGDLHLGPGAGCPSGVSVPGPGNIEHRGWLDLLRRRRLLTRPVGSLLQLPGASALWLLGGPPGAPLSSSWVAPHTIAYCYGETLYTEARLH